MTIFVLHFGVATYTLSTTKARRRFLSMVRDAGDAFSRYVFTHRGRPQAVMLGFEEYEGWLETLEISQSPTWRKALAQSRREDNAGRHLALEEVAGPVKRGGGRRSKRAARR